MSTSTLPRKPCAGCSLPIVWATLEGGHRVALEASERGTLLVQTRVGAVVHAGPASPGAARSARLLGRTTYLDHAGSCAHAEVWATSAERRRATTTRRRRR